MHPYYSGAFIHASSRGRTVKAAIDHTKITTIDVSNHDSQVQDLSDPRATLEKALAAHAKYLFPYDFIDASALNFPESLL